ncbi:MAG: bifunctional demethylmenaquinone methyltransferase/2-methoxy-6-polyprenyl-1,4-benzoquinol methylase UbiE [Pseudomonadota bacterium]
MSKPTLEASGDAPRKSGSADVDGEADRGAAATTHFGYQDVPVGEKEQLVRSVFDSVADRYDVMNDLMSLGIHRLWKRTFVDTARVRTGQQVLDLAGGTGDIAALLSDTVGGSGEVVLTDINASMLGVGRRRLEDRGVVGNVRYALANAEDLPFASRSFDHVTIAFGLRNVTDKPAALREMLRVLRPGGMAHILEFSQLRAEPLRRLYDRYSFSLLPVMGRLVAGDPDSYQYLAESIRKHPSQKALAVMMREAGFTRVHYRNLSGGIVAIHRGTRG